MPCRYDVPNEYGDAIQMRKMREDLDRLTAENDMLRDTIISMINNPDYVIDRKAYAAVQKRQIAHRKEDLKRLEKKFKESKDAKRLGLTMLANPNEPLEPQLGFNPDDF